MRRHLAIIVGVAIAAAGVLAIRLLQVAATPRIDADVLEVVSAVRQMQDEWNVVDDPVNRFGEIRIRIARFNEKQAKDLLRLASIIPSRSYYKFTEICRRLGYERPSQEFHTRVILAMDACLLCTHLPESIDSLLLLGEIKKETSPKKLVLFPYVCLQSKSNVVDILLSRFDEPQFYERVCIILGRMRTDNSEAVVFVSQLTNHVDIEVREAAVAAVERMR